MFIFFIWLSYSHISYSLCNFWEAIVKNKGCFLLSRISVQWLRTPRLPKMAFLHWLGISLLQHCKC